MQRRAGRRAGPAAPRWKAALGAAATLAVLVLGGALAGQDDATLDVGGPPVRPPAAASEVRDGLPTVAEPSLPAEARRVLSLIEDGGPFRYSQDGSVFGNREGLLPPEPRGCYREYTVLTPGERDRGARRIVTSCEGPRYWTADHYDSFARITGARL